MTLFDRFSSEAQFRDDFVKPFLNRLGFYGVEQQHGSTEFGKDFVFSELHRLGGMRHYAAQVKHEGKIHQGVLVDSLLSQVKQCFTVPFTRTDSPRPCHVSSAYVFNSGEITDNAKTQILGALMAEHFGDNVHFLDGDRLEALAEGAALANDRDARARLGALKEQLKFNEHIARSYLQCTIDVVNGVVHSRTETRGFMLAGLELYLSSPVPDAQLPENSLYNLWCVCRAIGSDAQLMLSDNKLQQKKSIETIKPIVPLVLDHIVTIQRAIDGALDRLRPLI
jgi:hypothetical protein